MGSVCRVNDCMWAVLMKGIRNDAGKGGGSEGGYMEVGVAAGVVVSGGPAIGNNA